MVPVDGSTKQAIILRFEKCDKQYVLAGVAQITDSVPLAFDWIENCGAPSFAYRVATFEWGLVKVSTAHVEKRTLLDISSQTDRFVLKEAR